MKTVHHIAIGLALSVTLGAAMLVTAPTQTDHTPPDTFLRDVAHDKERSAKWAGLRKKIITAHPYCAYCGGTEKLQAHHIQPFHLHPELELDPDNVIVLCELPGSDHHLNIGHLKNFRSEGNPNVKADCEANEAKMRAAGTWPREVSPMH